MSLKLLKPEPLVAKVILITVLLLCSITAFFFVRWNFANAVASKIDITRPETKLIIDSLIALGPSDPQTHYAAAGVFEKTFEAGDVERSVREYELAAALSPNNYQMWINLGRARNLSGDISGAEEAFKKALELAPNYYSVQWAYGNFLIRQGKTDQGFSLAAKASASNADLAISAVTLALQLFDGDVSEVRRALGATQSVNAALATALAAANRYEEAVASWSDLEAETRSSTQKALGQKLIDDLTAAKKFRLAAAVMNDLVQNGTEQVRIGSISNGGFEEGIKLKGARLFEWQIAEGREPQIGLSESQKRSGKYGLFLVFNSFEAAEFRTLTQTIPVEPGKVYEFEGYYRSDLKSTVPIKIQIVDAVSGSLLASTDGLALAGDWATMKLRFSAPQTSDGVIIRLARESCSGSGCRITGRLAFDDLSLRQ